MIIPDNKICFILIVLFCYCCFVCISKLATCSLPSSFARLSCLLPNKRPAFLNRFFTFFLFRSNAPTCNELSSSVSIYFFVSNMINFITVLLFSVFSSACTEAEFVSSLFVLYSKRLAG